MADPLLPHPCKVANSVGVFIEYKSGQRLNHKAVRLRLARLPRLFVAATVSKLRCDN